MRIDHRTVGVFEENCYLLVDDATGRGVLIDPGDESHRIIAMVPEADVTLDAIWLTHAHIDHIGAVAAVKRRFDVPVYLHPLDMPYYTRLSAHAAEMYGIAFEQPEDPDEMLTDGQQLHCGDLMFEVMHVPGHAPGLVAFTGHGVSFGGDLLFAGSIGRTDLPLGNASDMTRSLLRYTTSIAEETIVYPGHGPATTIGREKRTNPFPARRRAPHQSMIGNRAMMSDLVSLVVLSAWLGAAILVAAVVAPAAFAVLPTRTLAGALVGRVLPVLFFGGAAVGLLVALLARGQASAFARIIAALAMVIACLTAQLIVAPRIERVRLDAGGPIDRLAPDDPRRVAFGRLHGTSVALLGVAAIGGAAALIITLRARPEPATRHGTSNPSLEH